MRDFYFIRYLLEKIIMSLNEKMLEVVNSMLLEASLSDVFGSINNDDKLSVTTLDGKNHVYQVLSNMTGRIIMKDLSKDAAGLQYIIDRQSLNKDKLTLYKFDKEAQSNDFKGEAIEMKVEKILTLDTKSGAPQEIDVEPDEDDFRKTEHTGLIGEFNNEIKNLDKGDIIVITNETPNKDGGDSIVNDLFLKVINIEKDWYVFNLQEVDGDAEGEISYATQALYKSVSDKFIFVGGPHGFFKETEDGQVGIDLFVGTKNAANRVKLKGVIDVQNNSIEKDIDYNDDKKKFSKKELQNFLANDPTFRSMMMKKPSLMDTLTGASPKGLMQLKNMVQKHSTKNSYLTKGKNVSFKIMSPSIKSGDFRHKLLNRRNTYYQAKVTGENTLKSGTIGRGHWEIKLNKEVDDAIFQAKVSFCDADRTCNVITKEAMIQILTDG